MASPIFESFFWIEPVKKYESGSSVGSTSKFSIGTKVIWHYPEDVSQITKEFIDIPQFCFPGNSINLNSICSYIILLFSYIK